jgi:hypothetical protein
VFQSRARSDIREFRPHLETWRATERPHGQENIGERLERAELTIKRAREIVAAVENSWFELVKETILKGMIGRARIAEGRKTFTAMERLRLLIANETYIGS